MTSLPEPRLTEEERQLLEEGIRHFNRREFFKAHESWEEIWKEFPEPWRLYFQGLIQAAAGFIQLENGNAKGARINLDKSLPKMRAFALVMFGIENRRFIGEIEEVLNELASDPDRTAAIRRPHLAYHGPAINQRN